MLQTRQLFAFSAPPMVMPMKSVVITDYRDHAFLVRDTLDPLKNHDLIHEIALAIKDDDPSVVAEIWIRGHSDEDWSKGFRDSGTEMQVSLDRARDVLRVLEIHLGSLHYNTDPTRLTVPVPIVGLIGVGANFPFHGGPRRSPKNRRVDIILFSQITGHFPAPSTVPPGKLVPFIP